jgi:threonine/homoserine/homoserine lactone efflux protein
MGCEFVNHIIKKRLLLRAMNEALLYGMATGMVMSVMLGTVFFALIQNSIDHGAWTGMLIAGGVILSDIILIIIAYFNSTIMPEGGAAEMTVRILGSSFLCVYGITNIRSKKRVFYPESKRGRALVFIGTGFLLNILNPGNLIGWLAVSAYLTAVVQYTTAYIFTYYTGALISIFGMECLISFGAARLKKFVTPKFLKRIDIVIGILFLVFAVVVLWPVFIKIGVWINGS